MDCFFSTGGGVRVVRVVRVETLGSFCSLKCANDRVLMKGENNSHVVLWRVKKSQNTKMKKEEQGKQNQQHAPCGSLGRQIP